MSDVTIFEKILAGDIPANKAFENDKVFAFHDISPQAETHVLFIHKEKTVNINDLSKNQPEQLKDLFDAIREYTESSELAEKGFRVVTNCGPQGGQTVFYTHLHVLGGEQLRGFGA